jgi:uncharacterized membrane protein YqaE (UPF0057 family)
MERTVAPKRMSIPALIAAILLPPLGVFLERGMGPLFWISVVLTLLAFIPGVIFSVLAVLRLGV